MDDKTRISKLKLALLEEGGDDRMDYEDKVLYLMHSYSEIMNEPGIDKEENLKRMLLELGHESKDVEDIVKYVYEEDEEPIVENEEPVCDQEE